MSDVGLGEATVPVAHIGIMICYDWNFAEAIRELAVRGAEVLVGPQVWPTNTTNSGDWRG